MKAAVQRRFREALLELVVQNLLTHESWNNGDAGIGAGVVLVSGDIVVVAVIGTVKW